MNLGRVEIDPPAVVIALLARGDYRLTGSGFRPPTDISRSLMI
jgi:hypothetical protein